MTINRFVSFRCSRKMLGPIANRKSWEEYHNSMLDHMFGEIQLLGVKAVSTFTILTRPVKTPDDLKVFLTTMLNNYELRNMLQRVEYLRRLLDDLEVQNGRRSAWADVKIPELFMKFEPLDFGIDATPQPAESDYEYTMVF